MLVIDKMKNLFTAYPPFVLAVLSLAILSAMILAGCSTDSSFSFSGTGRLHVEVVIGDSDYSSDIAAGIPDASEFSLTIRDIYGKYSHTWNPWTDYNSDAGLVPSAYSLTAFYGDTLREGFNAPLLMARRTVTLNDGEDLSVKLECALSSAIYIMSFSDRLITAYPGIAATLHADGGKYIEYPSASAGSPLYLHPGSATLFIDLPRAGSPALNFELAKLPVVESGEVCRIDLDISQSSTITALEMDFNSGEASASQPLTPDFLDASAPAVSAVGFIPGVDLSINEGEELASSIGFNVDADNLRSLLLTFNHLPYEAPSLPTEIDILAASATQLQALSDAGVDILRNESGFPIALDFRRLLASVKSITSPSPVEIAVLAVGANGLSSVPLTLKATVFPVDIRVVQVGTSLIGVNLAEVVIESAVNPAGMLAIQSLSEQNKWVDCEIESINPIGEGRYRISFMLHPSDADAAVRLLYCGSERASFIVKKVSPSFSIAVDAFALKAYVKVIPDDPSLLSIITESLNVYANGNLIGVIDRDIASGIVTVGALSEKSRYSLKATVLAAPKSDTDFCPVVNIVTEPCTQIPNSDFEDVKSVIHVGGMPSGGRYSQSIVPIYNRQNTIDVSASAAKGWADCNSKTFCTSSSNFNTWYMQPSTFAVGDAYSGGYAMCIRSTGWDCYGDAIPDYLQESQPYVSYSRIVPDIKYKAAGKLFLGSYSFNPTTLTETYTEGIRFNSRPSRLNGYYRYVPTVSDPSDMGLVIVQLLGEVNGNTEVIASGQGLLSSSMSYRTFSVELIYTRLNVKATTIRVMFSSSDDMGSIDYETASVSTFIDIPSAASLGSSLWLDNLSLSY